MKTLTAIATAMMLFSVPAFGQSLIGEWSLVKVFCEGGKEFMVAQNTRRIYDDASTTSVNPRPSADKLLKTKGCALHIKTNYSMISDNQYRVGPFLEMSSPNCPSVAKHMNSVIKYAPSYIENENDEQFGTTKVVRERMARLVASLQKNKRRQCVSCFIQSQRRQSASLDFLS